ncbi:unnamed protein product [Urochloa humidicola]
MLPCGGDSGGAAPPADGDEGIDVLHHILGFLKAHEAVRTCVLAKRWRHLWKHTTGLLVVADKTGAFLGSLEKVWEFLGHLLPLREGSPLHTCELGLAFLAFYKKTAGLLDDDVTRRVNTWFWHAVTHKVRNLSFYALLWDHRIQLDDMPLNSQHLTRLEFTCVEFYSSFLNFSNCPTLEYQFHLCRLSYNISSKSLKRLIITRCSFRDDSRIYICAPNLVSFRIGESLGKTPVLESMPSLVEASIDLDEEPECSDYEVCHCEFCDNSYVIGDSIGSSRGMLLSGLSEAKNLTFKSNPKTLCLHFHLYKHIIMFKDLRWCPMFSKLKTLLLDDNWCVPDDFRALVCLLEHSPILEKLTLELSSKRRKRTIVIGDVRPMEDQLQS